MKVKKSYFLTSFILIILVLFLLFFAFPPSRPRPEWELVRVTMSPSDELSPVFSPDGKKIAYTERFVNDSKVLFNIRVIDLDRKEDKVIFSTSDLVKICSEGEFQDFDDFSSFEVHRLAWFGNKILFNTFCILPNEDKIIKMVIIDSKGLNPVILGAGEHPTWSPDGEKIVYLFKSSVHVPACGRCGKELWLMDSNGENRYSIYEQNNTLFWPSFSPDRKKIVFERREEDKRNDIYIIGTDGNNLKKLTTTYDNTYPRFIPDGDGILFVSNRTGADELYSLSFKTRELKRLTNISAIEACCIDFSPEGSRVVFSMLTKESDKGFDIWMMKKD